MQLKEFGATPIQKLGISINRNSIFMKRDDLFPLSFGGNKARKAVLFYEDFLRKKANCIITYGSSSSNHCRIIANICAAMKIPCYIISPNETSNTTTNSILVNLLGATVINCSINLVKETIEDEINSLTKDGQKPYFIQGGGHGNLGTEAYVEAYNEIVEYEKNTGIFFDYIFHTSGTGTTQAGLICGKLLNNDSREIIGISNARKNPVGSEIILKSVNEYLEYYGKSLTSSKEIIFIDDYILEGYGNYNKDILEIAKEVMVKEGIPLDTTYTAKTFWGMKEYILSEKISDKNILYIHTGGTPLFFDKLEEINNG